MRDKVASQRADLVVIKEKHDKWEMDLRAKLNKYREENRTLHAKCAGYAVTVEQLRALVADQETKLTNAEEAVSELERRLSTAEPKAERVDEFRTKNNQLVEQLLLWEEESRQHEERKKEVETLITLAIEKDHVIEAAHIKIAELTRHLECAPGFRAASPPRLT